MRGCNSWLNEGIGFFFFFWERRGGGGEDKGFIRLYLVGREKNGWRVVERM